LGTGMRNKMAVILLKRKHFKTAAYDENVSGRPGEFKS